MELPYLPPSMNEAYINVRGVGRVLSSTARNFKNNATSALGLKFHKQLSTLQRNVPYSMLLVFVFTKLVNMGWSEDPTVKKKAKNKFVHCDTSNRIKLLEDVLKDLAHIDDSQNMSVMASKVCGPTEKTLIWIWEDNDSDNPLYAITTAYMGELQPDRAVPVG